MDPLVLACIWAVAANLAALLPSRRDHWPAAAVLVAAGIPILGLVTYRHGPWTGLLILALGAWMLRWPVLRLAFWLRRIARRWVP